MLDRPAPAGPAAAGEVRQRDDRARRRRGRVREDAQGRGAALGGGAVTPSGPIDHVVTSGTFSLDGGTWDVDNNVWVVGDENEVLVVDAAHDAGQDRRRGRRPAGGGGRVHARPRRPREPAPALADRFDAPILLQPGRGAAVGDDPPGPASRTASWPTATCSPRAGSSCGRWSHPGHSPGSTCLYAPELGTVFTGDTLFPGGPGRDRAVVLVVRRRSSTRSATGCSTLPGDTAVRTGHGDSTTIGAEAPHLEEWIAARPLHVALQVLHCRRGGAGEASGSASCASTPRGTSRWPRPASGSP